MSLIDAEKTLAKDPVCGMSVDPATAEHRSDYEGTTYFFCCAGCRTKFAAAPERYLATKDLPAQARCSGRDLHLPDASRSPAGGPGRLPDLRHGAGAGDAVPAERGRTPNSST